VVTESKLGGGEAGGTLLGGIGFEGILLLLSLEEHVVQGLVGLEGLAFLEAVDVEELPLVRELALLFPVAGGEGPEPVLEG